MECWRRQKPADDVRRVWGCLGYKDELIPSDDVWGAFIDRTMSVRVAELICPASCSRVASSGIADNFGGGPEYLTPSSGSSSILNDCSARRENHDSATSGLIFCF